MVDLIVLRTPRSSRRRDVRRAPHASVPVINAMSARSHPCQLLGATFKRSSNAAGPIQDRTVAFVGDWLQHVQLVYRRFAPVRFRPADCLPERVRAVAGTAGEHESGDAGCDTPQDAVRGADLVVTDVWSSMGHEAESAERRQAIRGLPGEQTAARSRRARRDVHALPRRRTAVKRSATTC